MQSFHIRQNGFNEIKKRLILTLSIIFTSIFAIIILLPAFMSDDSESLKTLPYMLLIFVLVFIFSILSSIKKQRRIFESFTLEIDEEKIERKRLHTPDLVIYHKDIAKITKLANGSFSIQGKSKLNPIAIPAQIGDYQELETRLKQLKEVAVLTSRSFAEKMFIPISLSGAILMAVTFISKNNIVILISSILIVLILSASLIVTQLNKNIDRKTKRLSWVSLIPLLVFLSVAISKL